MLEKITKMRAIVFSFIYMAFAGSLNAQNGLVCHYPFDGDTKDISGYSNDGNGFQLQNTTDRVGNRDKAFYFNGIGSMVYASTTFPINPEGSFTYCAWVKMDSLIGGGHIIFDRTTASTPMVSLYVIDSVLTFYTRADGGQVIELSAPEKFNSDWHFVSVQRDYNQEFRLYIDGELVNQAIDHGLALSPPILSIGGSPISGGYGFIKGSIDEVKIFNRALTKNETDSLFSDIPASVRRTSKLPFDVQVYPNPAQDVVYVSAPLNARLVLYDVHGKILIEKISEDDVSPLDLRSISPGWYVLHVNIRDMVVNKWVMKGED